MSQKPLEIAAVEPYAATSHRVFLEELARNSRHHIELFTLPPRAWKWRMRTGAFDLAPRIAAAGPFDLLFVSDFVDLPELRALLPASLARTPAVAYFHENQLTYPVQEGERVDHHFALSHFHTMHAAEATLFNSNYHRDTFLAALEALLAYAPDVDLAPAIDRVKGRSSVLPLGTELETRPARPADPDPLIVWNHRWEHDKDPGAFAKALVALATGGERFRVLLLGQRFRDGGAHREFIAGALADRCEDAGQLDRAAYLERLAEGHIAVSTSRHEFFGLSTLEAIRSGLYPVLPNDLAYPELIPEELHADFLYPRHGGLIPLLTRALERVSAGEANAMMDPLQAFSDRFHWRNLAQLFDATFEEAAARASC